MFSVYIAHLFVDMTPYHYMSYFNRIALLGLVSSLTIRDTNAAGVSVDKENIRIAKLEKMVDGVVAENNKQIEAGGEIPGDFLAKLVTALKVILAGPAIEMTEFMKKH